MKGDRCLDNLLWSSWPLQWPSPSRPDLCQRLVHLSAGPNISPMGGGGGLRHVPPNWKQCRVLKYDAGLPFAEPFFVHVRGVVRHGHHLTVLRPADLQGFPGVGCSLPPGTWWQAQPTRVQHYTVDTVYSAVCRTCYFLMSLICLLGETRMLYYYINI